MPDTPPFRAAPAAYYQPSGKVARGALLIGMGYGLAIVPGAFLYACAIMRAPAWINFIVLLMFGLWIAVVVDLVTLKARIRNRVWVVRFAVALALCAWYFQWAVWMAMAMQRQHAGTLVHSAAVLALHPGALLAAATELALHNAWGLGAMPMVAVWLLEAFVLVQMAPGLGQGRVAQPFCETSGSWADQIGMRRKFAWIERPAEVAQLLEHAPQQLPSVLSAWHAAAPDYAEVTLYRCQDGNAYVSIRNVRVRRGKNGSKNSSENSSINSSTSSGTQPVVLALRLPGVNLDALIDKLNVRADPRTAQALQGDAPAAPQLASPRALFQAARFADAHARALAHVQAPQLALRLEANRLCALCCMRQNRWADAGPYWEAVFDDEPAVRHAMQLATCALMAGASETGQAWFARARAINAATREQAPLSLLSTFVNALGAVGQASAAMPWLDEIRASYCDCRVTEPGVLYARRMPLLSEFLAHSAPLVLAALGRPQGLRWYAAMLGRLDQAGNVELGQWLDAQERSLAG